MERKVEKLDKSQIEARKEEKLDRRVSDRW
jgi:hypothetical protein